MGPQTDGARERGGRFETSGPHGSVYDLWAEWLELCTGEDCAKWISGILAAVKRAGVFKINTLARYKPPCRVTKRPGNR